MLNTTMGILSLSCCRRGRVWPDPLSNHSVHQPKNEPEWAGDEDAKHRSLIRIGLEDHRAEEAAREADTPHYQRGSRNSGHNPTRTISEEPVPEQHSDEQ